MCDLIVILRIRSQVRGGLVEAFVQAASLELRLGSFLTQSGFSSINQLLVLVAQAAQTFPAKLALTSAASSIDER